MVEPKSLDDVQVGSRIYLYRDFTNHGWTDREAVVTSKHSNSRQPDHVGFKAIGDASGVEFFAELDEFLIILK